MNSSEQHNSCEFHDNLEVLQNQPLFTGVSGDIMRVLAYLCLRRTYALGDVINREGESSKGMGLVLCGEVALQITAGEQTSVLYTMGSGYLFGALACLGQSRHHTSLCASKEGTTCLLLPRDKLERTLARYPESYAILIRNLAARLYDWEREQISRYKELQPPSECPLTLF